MIRLHVTVTLVLALLITARFGASSSEEETHLPFIIGGGTEQSLTITVTVTPTATGEPTITPTATEEFHSGNWLEYTNYYRAMAQLPPVTENLSYSYGASLHAKYIVKNDVLEHTEDPTNPWYTPEGLAASMASNLAASFDVEASDMWAIDTLMQAPFHAIGILDPQLAEVGYGSYREEDGEYQMGAALDVIRGQTFISLPVVLPIMWPANGTTVKLTYHWGERPSPLSSCPGYEVPSGLPVILQIGTGYYFTPTVTSHAIREEVGNEILEHCVFDETSYTHQNPADQALGRGILAARNAIVLIPREPLSRGTTYVVSITTNGQNHNWSFTVSEDADTIDDIGQKSIAQFMPLDATNLLSGEENQPVEPTLNTTPTR